MVSRETEFGIGGAMVLASLFPIAIAIMGNFPTINPGLIVNFGVIGVLLGFLGFYMIGAALFRT
ncbi:MAG: hypothetical protein ACFFDQ_14035 [Candidatus Thorarchaeota archaeon]